MRAGAAIGIALLAWCSLVPRAALAQQAIATTLEVDAIGPRSARSVRAALRAHLAELERCRGDDDALVRIAFAIAPAGTAFEPRAIDDPDLDREATECVVALLRGWRVPGRASSVTTVSWSVRLHARGAAAGDADATGPLRVCFCFDWVHGGDHGRTCEPTRARCGRERRATDREATECARRRAPVCNHEAWIDGQHLRREGR